MCPGVFANVFCSFYSEVLAQSNDVFTEHCYLVSYQHLSSHFSKNKNINFLLLPRKCRQNSPKNRKRYRFFKRMNSSFFINRIIGDGVNQHIFLHFIFPPQICSSQIFGWQYWGCFVLDNRVMHIFGFESKCDCVPSKLYTLPSFCVCTDDVWLNFFIDDLTEGRCIFPRVQWCKVRKPPNVVLSEDPQPSSSDKVRKDKTRKDVELV